MTKKCALLIGITYPNTTNYLPGCENDIKNMYERLLKCGYTEFIICCDVAGLFSFKTLNTTWNDIQIGFSKLIDITKKNPYCEVFVHYSGHGVQYKDNNGDELDKKYIGYSAEYRSGNKTNYFFFSKEHKNLMVYTSIKKKGKEKIRIELSEIKRID